MGGRGVYRSARPAFCPGDGFTLHEQNLVSAPAVWALMAQERTLPTFYLGNYSEQSYQTWPIVTVCDKARSQGQGEMSENVKILNCSSFTNTITMELLN